MLHCIILYIIYTHSCYREYPVGGKYESVYGERNADMDNLTNANQDSTAATEMKTESKSVRQKYITYRMASMAEIPEGLNGSDG